MKKVAQHIMPFISIKTAYSISTHLQLQAIIYMFIIAQTAIH